MKVSVAIIIVVLFLNEPLSAQRLPRTRSRISIIDVEAASGKADTLKTKVKTKYEPKSTEAPLSTNSTTTSTSKSISNSSSSDASPPSSSPSPSPPSPSTSLKPSANSSTKTNDAANTTKESSNEKSPKGTSTTAPEPPSTSATVAPPVSSVQVRMAFPPAASVSKKLLEERNAKLVPKEDDSKNGTKSSPQVKKKTSDTQESPKDTTKKPASTSTSSPAPTTTIQSSTSKPTSTKRPDLDEEVRDALKKLTQEVLKQPRNQDAKTKSNDNKNTTTTASTKKSPKDTSQSSESGGLDTAETAYVRPVTVHHSSIHDSSALLDAQASIQSAKFVLRDQGLQQLPSFVRSKDRSRSSAPNIVRHILLQKQPLILQQQQQLTHRQRSHMLDDPIDEEANTSTTSTTKYPVIPIVHFDKEQSADGSYKTSYETANNIFAEETGFLKNPGVEDQEALVQQGSYSYTAPDGSLISVTYTADEMGFRAAGTHLPTPPPVPPEIQRSLDIIYAQIQRDEEEAAREAELERQAEASENHDESLDPPTTGSKRESRRYLP